MKSTLARFAPLTVAALALLAPVASSPAHAQVLPESPGAGGAASGDTGVYRGGTAHAGYVDTAFSASLAVLWQNTTTKTTRNTSSPAVAGDLIYFGAGPHVYALSIADGSVKWQYPKDGSEASGLFECAPTVSDGKVYIGCDDKNLYAFDALSGESLWRQATQGAVLSSPVVNGGAVFFGSNDQMLYAVKLDTQQPLWGGQFRSGGPVTTSPVIQDGVLYFVDGNSEVYGVNELTGRLLWQYRPVDGVSDGTPIYVDGTLVVGSGRQLVGLVARSGQPRWTTTFPSEVSAAPAVTGTNIYVATSDQVLYCVTPRGTRVWKAALSDTVTAPLLATRALVFAITRSGVMYAFDADTGALKWSYRISAAVPSNSGATSSTTLSAAPVIAGDTLYTLANDGTLTAFRASAPDFVAPIVTSVTPASGETIAGAKPSFSAHISDAGSGVRPDSVSLKVDGATIPVRFVQSTSTVELKTHHIAGEIGSETAIELATLTDGEHAAVLTASDWRGNPLTKTWVFTVDNKLNPAGSSAPVPLKPDSPTASATGPAGTSGQGADAGNAAANSAGGGALPTIGGPAGGGAPQAPAQAPGGGGGAPQAPAPAGGTAVPGTIPVPAQVPGGAGNFPPPPPI